MVMQIGQAAGALAALAVKEGKNIREVSVREVQNAILDGKGYLLPYLDVELDHPMFKSLQRIGSTGILKGIGKRCLLYTSSSTMEARVLTSSGVMPMAVACDRRSLFQKRSCSSFIRLKNSSTLISQYT